MALDTAEKIRTMSETDHICPNCTESNVVTFYKVDNVPVHSVLLFETREKAVNYTRGDIELGFCKDCGFIYNTKFDPGVHEYDSEYESSQAFSPTFNSFAKRLAALLVERNGLKGKDIIEIGCGQGEFLKLLCELGNNRGTGFDPAYNQSKSDDIKISTNGKNCDLSFIKDFYSEAYSEYHADFICCKMTLEHIQDTSQFVNSVRNSIENKTGTDVFFQIPEASRILDDIAFWDIYYEHCSYFSPLSLGLLFSNGGFDVNHIWTDFDDQYLMIDAVAGSGKMNLDFDEKKLLSELEGKIEYFISNYPKKLNAWKARLDDIYKKGLKTVVWGSSSKGVAFLTTLKAGYEQIEYVVDINPYRQGSFMAGTGQEIVSPDFLKEYEPDVVIVMNPIYTEEIKEDLLNHNLTPEVISV